MPRRRSTGPPVGGRTPPCPTASAQRRVVAGQAGLPRLLPRLARPRADLVRVRPRRYQSGSPTARFGGRPGDGVAVWHKDTAAIHVLLVAIERCGAVAVGARSPGRVREVTHDPADRSADLMVSDVERLEHAAAGGRRRRPAPSRRRARRWVRDLVRRHPPRPDGTHRPVTCRARRRLPDQLHVGHHRTCPNALSTPRTGGTTSTRRRSPTASSPRRRLPAGHPHPVRLRNLDLAHHADSAWVPQRSELSASIPPRRARRSSGTGRRCCVVSARNW